MELEAINKKILVQVENRIHGLDSQVNKLDMDIKKAESDLTAQQKELNRLRQYPERAAKATVQNIKKQKSLSDINFDNVNPARLKGRNLPIDVNHPKLNDYVVKNEAALAQMYNYTMGGRVSTKKVLGFDKPEDMRRHLLDDVGMSKQEADLSMETFELALGSKQIPSDPDSGWEQSVRMISHFNYLTMGGQFGITAMSEIGAGVYRAGFGYFKELFPALRSTIKQYKGHELTNMEIDSRALVNAASVMENKSHSAFADVDYIESTLAQGIEKGLKKMSTKMFKYSGLEGITTMTQVAIPRSFLERIIKEANTATAQLDMLRWGISPKQMREVAKQPFIRENGQIVDFNFSKWDPEIRDLFQKVTMRMSRDTIMRPDAVRVPTWLNDGGTAPLFKLTKQFMTFTFLSNERLMLAGLNEKQAMAVTGTIISGAILYFAKMFAEEVAVQTGIIEDKDRQYADEEGQMKLASYIATRNSFAGGIGMVAETLNSISKPWGDKELVTKFAGGPTGSRAFQMSAAAKDLMEGKQGTGNQVRFMKNMIPFNNLMGIDTFNKHMAADIAADAKANNYGR